jgi:hypothetical protein
MDEQEATTSVLDLQGLDVETEERNGRIDLGGGSTLSLLVC